MNNFYNTNVISNILKEFKVNTVIISGIKDETLINAILKYDATFTQINTNDSECISENPLDSLQKLENYDAIFIDDDSNWYTVFNELNIISKTNKEFPLVFICNNNFPNKRRDSYSNPKIIPNNFRQKYAEELPIYYNNEKIIINDGFFHACEENTPKNGVLTAIEDFLNENSHIGMIKINCIKEICILYPKLQVNDKRISIINKEIQNEIIDVDVSDKIIENQILISYINKYQLSNNNRINKETEISSIIEEYETKIRYQTNEIDFKNSQISGFESKLSLKDSEIKNIESKLVNRNREINDLEKNLKTANLDFDVLTQKINEAADEFTQKKSDYTYKINSLKDEIDIRIKKENELENELNKQININNEKDNQIKINQRKLDEEKKKSKSFKEEISNKQLEIEYMKNSNGIKKILSPATYLYLIFKSSPKEVSLNIKLYQTLKKSKCFDIGFYLNKNKDLINSKWCKYFSPELHYTCNGYNEKRKFNKKHFDKYSKKDLIDYLLNCGE
ncbi:hypothetical protein [Methanobrevibacter sp.]|uniref:hypothetical protein n=1 Tax=Methanobrevibacter sp. TaxID=66852 RepID=UPI002E790198|nr:hypothetical protein [Methanobrevibacter sp.]MEE0024321.1 hypothetical protein [Methanobrevibacter sp.]